jgi:hypothetical protein
MLRAKEASVTTKIKQLRAQLIAIGFQPEEPSRSGTKKRKKARK